MSFYFPYNFYPVTGEIKKGETSHKPRYLFDYDNKTDDTGKPTTAQLARHDVWQKDTYSGHINLTFTTYTPTLVGNTHKKDRPRDDNSPSAVTPYYWRGKLALPANSLRGMIASIAETLSQSTLRVLEKKYHPAFAETDSDLIPWKNNRTHLTPAEMLFGVVDTDGNDKGNTQNLASRLRFTDALLIGNNEQALTEEEIPLTELASPKADGVLPSIGKTPASLDAYNHYFKHRKTNTPATHGDVLHINAIKTLKPLGRKFYLKRRQLKPNDYTGSKGAPRSMRGKLINSGQSFETTLHFNNLSNAELALLEKSIQPHPQFIHQIGIGKALGLGALQLTAIQIQISNKKQRYAKTALTETSTSQTIPASELNDTTLIDEDTLKILITAGNLINLPSSEEVHWRDGRNTSTRPVPTLHPSQNQLPLAEAIIKPDYNAPIKVEDLQTDTDKDLANNNSVAANWLKTTIGNLNNNKDYSDLNHNDIVTIIKGKALSKKWLELTDADQKEEVLTLIHQQIEQRKIQRYELAAVAEKRYFNI